MEILLGSSLKILVGSDVTLETLMAANINMKNSKTNMQFVF